MKLYLDLKKINTKSRVKSESASVFIFINILNLIF